LILNELVTNALKHAFPKTGAKQGAEKGKISITLHQNKDAILLLKVVDNGVGLPEDLDLDLNKTLGLRLVKTLVRQLDATLDVDRDSGATFKVTFSKADE
ncbi:MAG TPA: sensor histidine kinase, partial [Anaerolineae bacterium]|nr:sensor histidine kinase [Anaerolineae bacterium]